MVVFICNACGQSVKKAQVDKHWQTQCRNCTVLSCIDCGKDFPGDTFRNHNQCMTEEEKWHGKDVKIKENGSSGRKKQDTWTENLQRKISESASIKNPQLIDILRKLVDFENVPRKEAKFKNFLKSCLKIHNPQIVEAAWKVVSEVKAPAEQTVPNASLENGSVTQSLAIGNQESSHAPQSAENGCSVPGDEGSTSEEPSLSTLKKFKWKRAILNALTEADAEILPKKKLKKKVIASYAAHPGNESTSHEVLEEKFEKYLQRHPTLFAVEGKSVKLIKS
ncbi:cell growth-regulating nucleolar protein-like [Paramacrobiotus metropolitanus]|uniref:cell growth-regulating nucleolar protein-like n=1 Tax=Paramacrobiotus metropolitanus TaxID=2943436 RepID=UPI002445C079|nr:cell growth-regulating nucleolar protein-like [Paramacrobiotus metropolitanus]XP_055332976.1 cell growth-regulating nucleolar protein-like [Paramacrobiotus metropolitanus]XP_055332977.1 cell growth-regulating nucleolar protein-like [Paramacrobiotus metropolitanus]XP_055332979.1 cell growth-regulating nucleolar protein-like [Paramacrobiotus metropolitanus]XP_055332980.1 cell growth-regulating nucleolar protein-like [Paramacrobiotus metropolitanus]